MHEGDLLAGHSIEFRCPLPPDAPPSLKTEHGELYWEMAVRSDESGFDTSNSRRVEVVAPGEVETETQTVREDVRKEHVEIDEQPQGR